MENNGYKTSDLSLASYLTYKGFGIERVESPYPDQPRKREIYFQRKQGERIEDVVMEYQNRKAVVEPAKFFDEIRHVKNIIYSHY